MHVNRNVSRTYASFRIVGNNLVPEDINGLLDISPHKSFRKGDKHGDKSWPHGYWGLTTKDHVDSTVLEVHIAWLLDLLEPNSSNLTKIVQKENFKADIFCFWESKTGHGGPVFSPIILGRLAKLNLVLNLDIYFAD
jgi:hypothetical protein